MAVTIRGKTLPLPILQGGMGVGISLDGLAGAVAACGGMGTLSTAVCGFQEPDFAVTICKPSGIRTCSSATGSTKSILHRRNISRT